MRSFSMRSSSASTPRPERMCDTAVRPSSTPTIRGSWGRYPKSPRRTTRPAAGSLSPPRTRNRLVLPAPLRPTRPTLSRGMTVKSADSTTSRPPTSTESPWAWSIRSGCQAERADPTMFAAAIVTRQGAGVATGPAPPPDDGWVAGGAGGLVGLTGGLVGVGAGGSVVAWDGARVVGVAAWVVGVAAPPEPEPLPDREPEPEPEPLPEPEP